MVIDQMSAAERRRTVNAHDKFMIGQRVVPTVRAFRAGLEWRAPKPVIGVVRGIPDRYPHWTVRVQVAGQKRVTGYHMDFWEPVAVANVMRFSWRCEICRKRGTVTMPANIDAWGGSNEVMRVHRVKSPKCRGHAGNVRVMITAKEAAKVYKP